MCYISKEDRIILDFQVILRDDLKKLFYGRNICKDIKVVRKLLLKRIKDVKKELKSCYKNKDVEIDSIKLRAVQLNKNRYNPLEFDIEYMSSQRKVLRFFIIRYTSVVGNGTDKTKLWWTFEGLDMKRNKNGEYIDCNNWGGLVFDEYRKIMTKGLLKK